MNLLEKISLSLVATVSQSLGFSRHMLVTSLVRDMYDTAKAALKLGISGLISDHCSRRTW